LRVVLVASLGLHHSQILCLGVVLFKGGRSDEDKCFVGNCPQLMYGGSYGDDATKVFVELCEMVEEAIETLEEAGEPLPQPLALHSLGSVLQRSA
jgi:predicted RNase H-like HicB family nuclease